VEGRKVIITGGAGFIGSNLAEELCLGNEVIIIDDLSTGREENLASLTKKDNVTFIQGSILNLKLLEEASGGADFVFHEAAIPSVSRSVADPIASNEANVTGTLNVLIAAKNAGVKKVVFASSSSVYGDTPTLPKREDMHPTPQSPYAASKLAGEYYCQVFWSVYGLETICLRYFNVYGPRQDPNSQYAAVIPRFIKRIQEGKPPVIFGDGHQTRDFTFVKDVVQANLRAAESEATGPINIARGERLSINELAGIIARLLGTSIKPIHEEPRVGDVRHSLADITRAREALGYQPQYSLEKGLRETIERT